MKWSHVIFLSILFILPFKTLCSIVYFIYGYTHLSEEDFDFLD